MPSQKKPSNAGKAVGGSAATDPVNEKLESISIKPTKANIAVKLVALAWMPHWQDAKGQFTAAWY